MRKKSAKKTSTFTEKQKCKAGKNKFKFKHTLSTTIQELTILH